MGAYDLGDDKRQENQMWITATSWRCLILAAVLAPVVFGCQDSTTGGQCPSGWVPGTDGQCVRLCVEDWVCENNHYCSDGECKLGLRPEVTSHWPPQNGTGVPVDAAISLTFSEPMDERSTQLAFSLMNDDQVVLGTYAWKRASHVLTFTPDRLLVPNSIYSVKLKNDATSDKGIRLEHSFWFSFQNFVCENNGQCNMERVCSSVGACVCNAEPRPESLCDGIDNDCNGRVDEEFVIRRSSCGEGDNASTGYVMCADGQLVDTCSSIVN